MRMKVIFDLDGTLALNEHRQHFIQKDVGKKDWVAFADACDKDQPNTPIIRTLLQYYNLGHEVQIWSGRTDRVKAKTVEWLDNQGLGSIPLRMRPDGDYQSDVSLKQGWLDQELIKPCLVFDDRNSVVQMWRNNGIVCCQVAEGNF